MRSLAKRGGFNEVILRGQTGALWKVWVFSLGTGVAADEELIHYDDVRLAERTPQKLDFPDILAIKGLGQFK